MSVGIIVVSVAVMARFSGPRQAAMAVVVTMAMVPRAILVLATFGLFLLAALRKRFFKILQGHIGNNRGTSGTIMLLLVQEKSRRELEGA